jgi:D-hexose-6-phosphate mutarotase
LQLTVVVGEKLEMRLATTNLGTEPVQIGEALHTYFQVGDIGDIQVGGLSGGVYYDKVENFAKKTQRGDIRFDNEVDRVYINTPSDCMIEDPQLQRRIRVDAVARQSESNGRHGQRAQCARRLA